jgi:hypothetical protein
MQSFMIVLGQVTSLFLMMAVGFGMYKAKALSDEGAAQMTDLLLYAVTPCVVIHAFEREFDPQTARAIGIFAAAGALVMVFGMAVGTLLFRGGDEDSRAVQRFAVVFSNCGFMGIPLAGAVCGADGTLYASVFVVIFNLFQWTYGFAIMSGERLSVKKAILNPCVLGLAIGLPLFLLSIRLPLPLENAVGMLADLNSPLAMIVIGTRLAKTDFLSTLGDTRCYVASLIRLVMMPAVVMAMTVPLPWLDATQTVTLAVMCGAPVAASCALFATKYRRDAPLAGRMVALSTAFSIVTLPLLVTAVKWLTHTV